MKRSITAGIVFNVANQILKDNLVNVGIGGSYSVKGDKCSDVDMILVTRKTNLWDIKILKDELERYLRKKVSISHITELELRNKFYGDKMMTMIWKGCEWMYPFKTDFNLAEKTLELLPESIQRIKKSVVSGKITEGRALDLLEQHLVILWSYRNR